MQGGLPGAKKFASSETLVELLKKQKELNRPYGAICASPALVLEPHGLLTVSPFTMFTLCTFTAYLRINVACGFQGCWFQIPIPKLGGGGMNYCIFKNYSRLRYALQFYPFGRIPLL